jgi:hypothetical protein
MGSRGAWGPGVRGGRGAIQGHLCAVGHLVTHGSEEPWRAPRAGVGRSAGRTRLMRNRNQRRRVNIRSFAVPRPRALKEWLGRRQVAQVLKQPREGVEAYCRVRVLRAEHLLPDRQRPLEKRSCRGQGACRSPVSSRIGRPHTGHTKSFSVGSVTAANGE